jgi:lysozyme family protein
MTTSQIMDKAFEWILRTEGSYVDDPNDRGGETKYGISKRSYPDLDIADLTIEDAQEIYRVDYFDAHRCGELHPKVGLFLFDMLVNHRPKAATRMLQRAVGATADGIIGPNTINLANGIDADYIVRELSLDRLDLYDTIIARDRTQARFKEGWRGRVLDLLIFIHTKLED